jgi:hypothetical protein
VLSFYSMYTSKPKGKYVIRVCESPPCHVNGAENMLEALQEELGLAVGETTADGCFTLEKTACLGVCEVAPAMQINEVVVGHLTRDRIKQVLADYRPSNELFPAYHIPNQRAAAAERFADDLKALKEHREKRLGSEAKAEATA